MSEPIVISHSEVESYLLCNAKHYYAFIESTYGPNAGLEPKTFSNSLYRGIVGHEALGAFFNAIKDGATINEAAEVSYSLLRNKIRSDEVLNNPNYMNILSDLSGRILPRFYANEVVKLLSQGWTVVHAEETFRLRMNFEEGTYVYPFTPDAILRDRAGNLWVWDHKFVYNFYSEAEIKLLPQLPKYIGALRALGLPIKGGYYNMLRWREVKDESAHVAHSKVTPNDTRVQNSFLQQYRLMELLGGIKQRPDPGPAEIDHTLNGMICRSCSFKTLCAADLSGVDTKLMKRVEFRKNTYGYTADE